MFGKLTIALLHCLSQAYGLKPQWDSLKLHKDALKKNCRNPGDTRRCFNVYKMSTRRRLTLVNARFYDDDILGVCQIVPKTPSHKLIISLFHFDIFFIYVSYSYPADK